MSNIPARPPAHRRVRALWALADAVFWALAVVGASWLRWLYESAGLTWWGVLVAATTVAVLHLGTAYLVGVYRQGQVRGSYEEIRSLAQCALTVTPILLLATVGLVGTPKLLPGTVPVIAAPIALSGMLAFRLVWREWRGRRARRDATHVAVYGAGAAGRLLVRNLVEDSSSEYVPVALVDDDPKRRGLRIEGVRCVGGREVLPTLAAEREIEQVVIAVPSATAEQIREMHKAVEAAGLKTLVVPPLSQLVGGMPRATDVRDLRVEDLLGRHPVTLDEGAIAEAISGKTVLVTGAGGSIGSELCRQISRFGVGRLVMLDRDESALHGVQLDLQGDGLLQSDDIVLADIRDQITMRQVFQKHRPHMVFHAAALKHLPLLEKYPYEAWQTNVQGTVRILEEAARVGVETFVNISTDKAASPTSVLGFSKRIAERVTADYAARFPGRFLSVRFGNVLGSRGSVIPAFQKQIRRGGPVTVTHPDVERYFMLIPEACQLVLQAAVLGEGGEVMVLEMGSPVKILDVARAMIDMSGRHDVDIEFTGLRPGEKMSEDLFSAPGTQKPTAHELVRYVHQKPIDAERLAHQRPRPETVTEHMRAYAMGEDVEDEFVGVVELQAAALGRGTPTRSLTVMTSDPRHTEQG